MPFSPQIGGAPGKPEVRRVGVVCLGGGGGGGGAVREGRGWPGGSAGQVSDARARSGAAVGGGGEPVGDEDARRGAPARDARPRYPPGNSSAGVVAARCQRWCRAALEACA